MAGAMLFRWRKNGSPPVNRLRALYGHRPNRRGRRQKTPLVRRVQRLHPEIPIARRRAVNPIGAMSVAATGATLWTGFSIVAPAIVAASIAAPVIARLAIDGSDWRDYAVTQPFYA